MNLKYNVVYKIWQEIEVLMFYTFSNLKNLRNQYERTILFKKKPYILISTKVFKMKRVYIVAIFLLSILKGMVYKI